MTSLQAIVSFLDRELNLQAFNDSSHNGLQVENSGRISRVAVGVDASLAFFEEAARRRAQLVICHHGLSWGDSLKRISGIHYRRLKFLLDHDLALYACHLPLDAHPRLGNNAQIARAVGLRGLKPFGMYHGSPIGFRGRLPAAMPYAALKAKVRRIMGNTADTMDFGPRRVRTVAVVSGAAAELIDEVGRNGIDVFLSGEPSLAAYHLAREYKVNAIFSGHYATETFGVRALARRLASRFSLKTGFINMGIRF